MNDLLAYDPLTNQWMQKNPLPMAAARQYAEGFSINSTGFVATGRDTALRYQNDCWAYDAVNDAWQQVAAINAAGRKGVLSFVIGTNAYVCTGIDSNNTRLSELWQYTPTVSYRQLQPPACNITCMHDQIIVQSNTSNTLHNIRLFNVRGSCILSLMPHSKIATLKTTGIQAGIYFLQIQQSQTPSSVYKIHIP